MTKLKLHLTRPFKLSFLLHKFKPKAHIGALVACRLKVYEVALGVVFDAGDVVVYPFRRL
jgi:hypothetical protein